MPLLRFDVGAVMQGVVGSSEENMRKVIQTAEASAPCILWLDEIEKGLSGTGSSNFSDAGTTARVFATFLTWLNEKNSEVFVVATANDVSQLPPELLRKGRFDETFFVDLPSFDEREEIFGIHLAKKGRDPKKFHLDTLAEASEGFSGADITAAIESALFDVYTDDMGKVDISDLNILKAIRETVPLSKMMGPQIKKVKEWCTTNRARLASSRTGGE
jgi:SpoVK/Ycf46/Vps4 family AAA+-type ATPase